MKTLLHSVLIVSCVVSGFSYAAENVVFPPSSCHAVNDTDIVRSSRGNLWNSSTTKSATVYCPIDLHQTGQLYIFGAQIDVRSPSADSKTTCTLNLLENPIGDTQYGVGTKINKSAGTPSLATAWTTISWNDTLMVNKPEYYAFISCVLPPRTSSGVAMIGQYRVR